MHHPRLVEPLLRDPSSFLKQLFEYLLMACFDLVSVRIEIS